MEPIFHATPLPSTGIIALVFLAAVVGFAVIAYHATRPPTPVGPKPVHHYTGGRWAYPWCQHCGTEESRAEAVARQRRGLQPTRLCARCLRELELDPDDVPA